MLDPRFVLLAAVLNLAGSWSYVVATLRGRTRPNRVSWSLWALAPLIAFVAQLQQGVGLRALTTFMVGFSPLMVLTASFAHSAGRWRIGRLDILCGVLSLAGLGLWMLTRTGNIAIIFSIAADALAAVPTVVKAYRDPASEHHGVYLMAALSAAVTLLTITDWDFAYYGFPLYILIICLGLFVLIRFRLGARLATRRPGDGAAPA